jgi:hypothetical protein
MSTSYTVTDAVTFTVTHARHLASKVATDLNRIQRLYDLPSDHHIEQYELELVELLKWGYLGTVTYGFKRGDQWIEPTLRYTSRDLLGSDGQDDDPGKVRPGADVSGASFHSYLTYSTEWDRLSSREKADFKDRLPFQRNGAQEPGISGYLSTDLSYSSGGRALCRSSVRGY